MANVGKGIAFSITAEKHGVNAFSQNEIEHFECCDDDVVTSGEGTSKSKGPVVSRAPRIKVQKIWSLYYSTTLSTGDKQYFPSSLAPRYQIIHTSTFHSLFYPPLFLIESVSDRSRQQVRARGGRGTITGKKTTENGSFRDVELEICGSSAEQQKKRREACRYQAGRLSTGIVRLDNPLPPHTRGGGNIRIPIVPKGSSRR
ncbi:hypothetical protein AVEN_26630-1 [Araneus ventricosus]|uniref:Uncharacterized protein n=1 Tax=Araneus ventricosus TaxID=182803 RepID=A0A4Y2NHG2_ARAVE|nr:hypothetical protein AVEN_26630-1 [Araneus ventricosus]